MQYVDKREMQHQLFHRLSAMFAEEVPLYDKSLLVNRITNRTVCDLLSKRHEAFEVPDEMLDRASGERHGAIRIGRPDEYRWMGRFFAAFAMEPHGFYDMANVGAKSQPIVATAFRSRLNPEHRVFTSLLLTDYFEPRVKRRIEEVLSSRQVMSPEARELVQKSERQGGLNSDDAQSLIGEATGRIFKWTGKARDHRLYDDLCNAGFKIAADIVCFESHHLNHLTPNTFCMDLFTSAMKFCMGEIDESELRSRATSALTSPMFDDDDVMSLCLRGVDRSAIDGKPRREVSDRDVASLIDGLLRRLTQSDIAFGDIRHAGFKDSTEGPSHDTPVLLRQDAYKALTEAVELSNDDGSVVHATHTARFGEVEQRFYATTKKGRELYDRCLAAAEAEGHATRLLARTDHSEYQRRYARHFAPFPKTLGGLFSKRLVHARYEPTARGLQAKGGLATSDIDELVRAGFVRVEGLRYEDFLPVSAAGIFASNLNQYGTQASAAVKPVYTQEMLEDILGRSIVDIDAAYETMSLQSLHATLDALGIMQEEVQLA